MIASVSSELIYLSATTSAYISRTDKCSLLIYVKSSSSVIISVYPPDIAVQLSFSGLVTFSIYSAVSFTYCGMVAQVCTPATPLVLHMPAVSDSETYHKTFYTPWLFSEHFLRSPYFFHSSLIILKILLIWFCWEI